MALAGRQLKTVLKCSRRRFVKRIASGKLCPLNPRRIMQTAFTLKRLLAGFPGNRSLLGQEKGFVFEICGFVVRF